MTLEEKCGQLNFVVGSILTGPSLQEPKSSAELDAQIRKGEITGIFNTNGAKNIQHLQEVAVKESRLGIPLWRLQSFGTFADVVPPFSGSSADLLQFQTNRAALQWQLYRTRFRTGVSIEVSRC